MIEQLTSAITGGISGAIDKGINSATDRLLGRSDNFNEGLEHQDQAIQRRNYADITSRVDAAKAAGIHPLIAMGVSPSGTLVSQPQPSGTGYRASKEQSAISKQLAAANMAESLARARQANASAESIIEETMARANARLATQDGNPPFVTVPNQVQAHVKGKPQATAGISPSEATFAVEDAWSNKVRNVKMPSKDYGQGVEQLGEVWQAVLGTPFALDVIWNKYLQSPADYLRRLNTGKTALGSKGKPAHKGYRRWPKYK